MDPNLSALLSSPDTSSQSQALLYFNQLVAESDGWTLCVDAARPPSAYDHHVTFFCLRVLEEFSRTRYSQETPDRKQLFRNLLLSWMEHSPDPSPAFLLKKKCQILTHVFLQDYPDTWPSFFSDLLSLLPPYSPDPTLIYLHTLLCMSDEVMDKTVTRTPQEQFRANHIKDRMREETVPQLVESWMSILSVPPGVTPDTLCTALKVVGLYAQWIELPYVINPQFLELFLQLLGKEDTRMSVVETLQKIVTKGMDRVDKLELIEMLTSLLVQAGLLQTVSSVTDFDLEYELSRFLNLASTQLLTFCISAVKEDNQLTAAHPYLASIHGVFSYICSMLASEDDGISENILPCCINYVSLLKSLRGLLTEDTYSKVAVLLMICFDKFKFDDSHSFSNERENEVLFLEYRKELKVLFSSICALLPQLVLSEIDKQLTFVIVGLQSLQYMDVEVLLYIIFLAEEFVPWKHTQLSADLTNSWDLILIRLLDSSISLYPHEAVSYQFLENLVRCVTFFKSHPAYLPQVLSTFLDERGVKNPNPRVRSRACFLLARFLKESRASIRELSLDVLSSVLLLFDENLIRNSQLMVEELRFLYESAGVLIMFSSAPQGNKGPLLQSILAPILEQFHLAFDSLHSSLLQLPPDPDPVPAEVTEVCRTLCDLMRLASFASKSVSSQQVAEETGCLHVFLHLLEHFSKVLAVPLEQDTLQEGFRPFLHRMVVVLVAGFLPFLPELLTRLLHAPTHSGPQECCILLNQIVSAYPDRTAPHLDQLMTPCISPVLSALTNTAHKQDMTELERMYDLVRAYLSLSHTLAHNTILVHHLLQLPPPTLLPFLSSLSQVLTSCPRPALQKQATSVLKQMLALRDKFPVPLIEFSSHQLLPALFLTPAKRSFNLNDGQTSLLLNDVIITSLSIIHRDKNTLVAFLTDSYLPSLSIQPELTQQYKALITQSEVDVKTMKSEFVLFYSQLQSRYDL